eukprot:9918425-Alexandrium_andersonii.AAC.1
MHAAIEGQVRVLLTHVKRMTGKTIVPEDRLFAWAVRHAGWTVGRCVVWCNGTTPYMTLTGAMERAR